MVNYIIPNFNYFNLTLDDIKLYYSMCVNHDLIEQYLIKNDLFKCVCLKRVYFILTTL